MEYENIIAEAKKPASWKMLKGAETRIISLARFLKVGTKT